MNFLKKCTDIYVSPNCFPERGHQILLPTAVYEKCPPTKAIPALKNTVLFDNS